MHADPATCMQEAGPVADLLSLLWHTQYDVRRATALALPGGDMDRSYAPTYGHFAGALLRQLTGQGDAMPTTTADRYEAVVTALRALLEQSNRDIRAMSNMRYSFLSNGLYLALLSTCRDIVESIRRLQAVSTHSELCRLLGILKQSSVVRRLNPRDAEALAHSAASALAAMPADEITEFWHLLARQSKPQSQGYADVLDCLHDPKAVPHLLNALAGEPLDMTGPILVCLGRLGDARALPALEQMVGGGNRALRVVARNAISAIQRRKAADPSHTLLRPLRAPRDEATNLLRPISIGPIEPELPHELLRSI